MPEVRFNQYYRYNELTKILQGYAQEFPHLIDLCSIGKSYEGREIWLVTATNRVTGRAEEKPALWIDGNIHAIEIAPSLACLYLIHALVKGYGCDREITRCLDTRAFYICPRVNPDGAELALSDSPKFIRSGTRVYPGSDVEEDGLVMEDIDGDGRILTMRVPDTNGPWKVSPADPRLMMLREPTEVGGEYYRLLPEGTIENYDGLQIPLQAPKEGLDFNRNFPFNWRQDDEQDGAGPYPTSESEVRSLVDFATSHPNITGSLSFHTMGGLLLRPSSQYSDDDLPQRDRRTYGAIGKKGTELTGYPAISIYHGYRANPKEVVTGAFDDWMYEDRGVFAWTVELWSPMRQAGITDDRYIDWFREHPFEDELKLLRWHDEELDGEGYIDWYPFEHPQLGKIELGGWNELYTWCNPPHNRLECEIAPFPQWLVWHLLISPRLELHSAIAQPLGDNTYRVSFVIQNTGWLPTNVTQKALEKKLARGCLCSIELPEGACLEFGKRQVDIGQLEGRNLKPSGIVWHQGDETQDRGKVEWIVRAPAGTTVQLTARHDRAGVVRAEAVL
ncbi:M14 family metallopeptidase [Oscillatoria sp. FACHB-1406]|uniref:M14 family metallopeptidase n=1 Tax=Oscillatoria sp. FACHB-1406 TaxID=2692846 RepID=UPI0016820F90|nr:M14 family metallopeptidase [Oscillatoria sp. FACHB-1406]MBD2577508.1 carboxypeptidase [Oscillatoria sp. FACHB-1406]